MSTHTRHDQKTACFIPSSVNYNGELVAAERDVSGVRDVRSICECRCACEGCSALEIVTGWCTMAGESYPHRVCEVHGQSEQRAHERKDRWPHFRRNKPPESSEEEKESIRRQDAGRCEGVLKDNEAVCTAIKRLATQAIPRLGAAMWSLFL